MKQFISLVLVASVFNMSTIAFAQTVGGSAQGSDVNVTMAPAPAPVFMVSGVGYRQEYQVKDSSGNLRIVQVANIYKNTNKVDVREMDGSVHSMNIDDFKKEVTAQATFPQGQDPFAPYSQMGSMSASQDPSPSQPDKKNLLSDGRRNTIAAGALLTSPIWVPVGATVIGGAAVLAAHGVAAVTGGVATVANGGINLLAGAAHGLVAVLTNPIVDVLGVGGWALWNWHRKWEQKKRENAAKAAADKAKLAAQAESVGTPVAGDLPSTSVSDSKAIIPITSPDQNSPTAPLAANASL
jgi:hypothetical protein